MIKMTNIKPNPNPKLQINRQKYNQAINGWVKDMREDLKKSKKKWRKHRKWNIWYILIIGSLLVCYEIYAIGNDILNFDGSMWVFILFNGLRVSIIAIWCWLIYKSIKDKKQMKIDDNNDMLEELEIN